MPKEEDFMEYNDTTEKIITAAKKMNERRQRAQELVNKLSRDPHYSKYVRSHKLREINRNLAVFDRWLDQGILYVPRRR